MHSSTSGAVRTAGGAGTVVGAGSRARAGYGGLVVFACVLTFMVITWGGLVRATGAGLACPDWPTCNGKVVPTMDTLVLLEWGHRFVAATLGIVILGATLGAWRWFRRDRAVLIPATLAFMFLIIQVALGALTVTQDLSPQIVSAHLGTSLLILASLVVTAAGANGWPRVRRAAGLGAFPLVALFGALMTFGLMLTGTYVVGSGAGAACQSWPQCDGLTGAGNLVQVHMFHRVAVLLVGAVVGLTAYQAWKVRRTHRLLWMVAAAGVGIYLTQALVGAGNIWFGLVPPIQVAHIATAALMWATMVLLATLAWRMARGDASFTGGDSSAVGRGAAATHPGSGVLGGHAQISLADQARAYVALTKPRIIELLLVTTVPAMVLAQRGLPSLWLMTVTVLGGALTAGGANALNCYIDRDIDAVMQRTRNRPLPRAAITPGRALVFALVIEAVGFGLLAVFANLLAAVLAVSATLFYIGVYTLWLKRRSAQNIVVGGAAGSVPPLVGWAAVTGTLEWPAFVLFLIVFFWTPAHFWALALKYRDDYAAANVPMAPVVWGAQRTYRQIVLYTAITVGVAFILIPLGTVGVVYAVAATLLGGAFLLYALRLRQQASTSSAMRLFTYSIVYLFALFAVMMLDQAVQNLRGASLG